MKCVACKCDDAKRTILSICDHCWFNKVAELSLRLEAAAKVVEAARFLCETTRWCGLENNEPYTPGYSKCADLIEEYDKLKE